MWQILGFGLGAALAFGVAGHRGQHWAVRVLCGAAVVLLLVALVIAWLFGGRDSPAGDVSVSLALSFVVVAAVLCVAWLVPWLKENAGKATAGVVVACAVVAVVRVWGGVPGVEAAAGYSEAVPVVVQVEKAAPESCLCSQGAACVGPRGGRYCLSDAGVKRYMQGGDK